MNTPILFAQTAATTAAPAAPAVSAAPATTAAAAPATTTTATETQPAAPKTAPDKPSGNAMGMPVMMLLLFAIFYFMMIKPQQRKEKERQKMINELRAGARVVFAGGFIGTIVEAKEKTFKIEIAGDVVVEVARAAVQNIVEPEKA